MQFDLEKDGEEFFEDLQKEDFARFNGQEDDQMKEGVDLQKQILTERMDQKTLESVSKLPDKIQIGQPPLSEKLLQFESQQAYLESLNLREVCYKTFSTLQDSINKV